LALPKKKVKKEKGKAREAIKAAGRETTYEVARGKPADGQVCMANTRLIMGPVNGRLGSYSLSYLCSYV